MGRPGTWRTAASYVLAYVFWGLSVAAGAVVGYLVQRALVQMATITVLGAEKDPRAAFYADLRIRAEDAWLYILIGMLLVLVLVFLEYWYRTGVSSSRLLARFLLVTTVELGILFLAHGVYFVVARLAGVMSWRSVYVPALELAATVLCACLYGQQARQLAKR